MQNSKSTSKSNHIKNEDFKVSVSLRLKPTEEKEKVVKILGPQQIQVTKPPHDLFIFDHIYQDNATNDMIQQELMIPILNNALQGLDSLVFMYGQSGSGKTFTMKGSKQINGIVQLSVEYILNKCHQVK
ncbi:Kinesin-like protein kip2 [Paramecium bursaria]